jgi:hypothetical protein
MGKKYMQSILKFLLGSMVKLFFRSLPPEAITKMREQFDESKIVVTGNVSQEIKDEFVKDIKQELAPKDVAQVSNGDNPLPAYGEVPTLSEKIENLLGKK